MFRCTVFIYRRSRLPLARQSVTVSIQATYAHRMGLPNTEGSTERAESLALTI